MGHREALLVGARRCLQERGYARTTARDLVAASGTNLASIGYHFGSKEALLDEAVTQAAQEWSDQLGHITLTDPGATPLQRIRATWQALADSLDEHQPLIVAFLEALAQADRSLQVRTQLADCYERLRAQTAEVVRETLSDLPPDTARTVAAFFIAIADGLIMQWWVDPTRAPAVDELWIALGLALPAILGAE